ncbi:LexA family transcriptional regulator [Acinetobacter sp. B5B]|uniref:LexA family transcriptional regulator n=1 Tax=Acinetobacter baretiae TaxID=2605383 RepID=UPI0018C31CDE|nr:LexA family transcriptional regulator [Acinetobacter baretiae]MBF7683885.1 LexA family transcriptional regulator [Acinetobacter baretiae]
MNKRTISIERLNDAMRLKKIWEEFKAQEKEKGRKISQEDVSEGCGWHTQAAFSAYLNGRTPINFEALIKLSKFFQVSPAKISPELAQEMGSVSISEDELNTIKGCRKKQIGRWVPVKAFSKMGMDGYFSDMGYEGDSGDGYVPSLTMGKFAYAVKGTGDSMYPVIRNGWFLVCDPEVEPSVTEFVEVQFKDGRRTIKEFIGIINNVLHVLAVNGNQRLTFDIMDIERIVAVVEIVPPSRHTYEIPTFYHH